MIDFSKITETQFNEIKNCALRAQEKSPLNRDYFVFDAKTEGMAQVYIFACRFLTNIYNMIEEGDLKQSIKAELDKNKETYDEARRLKEGIDRGGIFNDLRFKKLFKLTCKTEVSEMIDLISALLEQTDVINMSKFKGVSLEGKSKEEFAKFQKEFQSV